MGPRPRPGSPLTRPLLILCCAVGLVTACAPDRTTVGPDQRAAPTATTTPVDSPTAPDPRPADDDCDAIAVELPTRLAQDAAQCMPTAAAMAASAVGRPLTPREVARTMRMHPDGAHFFDLEEALIDLGLAAATTVADIEQIAVAMHRGHVPIVAVDRGAQRHVVVVTRLGRCEGDDEVTVTWVDPIDGLDHSATARAFARQRSADQVLFVGPAGSGIFDAWPLDGAATLRATHARFRADTLYRRALAHGDAGDQAMRLMHRASAEDPCWQPPRDWMHVHRPDGVDGLAPCPGP